MYLADRIAVMNKGRIRQVGSPDEVAFEMGFIDRGQLKERAVKFGKNDYGSYLEAIADKRN
ncbi:MAG: hypothetical protein EBS68_17690 [Rhodobacteraceae bacterium]|nr:hypothetical protein [Paracoccaceae bacterium]